MVDRADVNGSPPTINTYKCCIKYYKNTFIQTQRKERQIFRCQNPKDKEWSTEMTHKPKDRTELLPQNGAVSFETTA